MNTVPVFNYNQNNLFRQGDNFQLNACVGRNGGPYRFDAYALGYFRAAENLAQTIMNDTLYIDLLIYPLVYLYRHGIELSIKLLLQALPPLWGESKDIKLTHKLLDNWGVVKSYLEREESFDSDGTLIPSVEQALNDFVAIDPSGVVFRFPETIDGSLHLQSPQAPQRINIEIFAEEMKHVTDVFEYWFYIAGELGEYKLEMEEYYQNIFGNDLG